MKQPSVNDSTTTLSPQEYMNDLVQVLPQIITILVSSYMGTGLWYFSKCDIKDIYWRLRVEPYNALNFEYVLPKFSPNKYINEKEWVVPGSIQMGWKKYHHIDSVQDSYEEQ